MKGYTAVLVGLTQQGEWATAREVEERVQGRGFKKDFGWRIALQRLGKKDGLGRNKALDSKAREMVGKEREEMELKRVEERVSV